MWFTYSCLLFICFFKTYSMFVYYTYLKPHELLSYVGNITLFYWWKILRFREVKCFAEGHTAISTWAASRNELELYLGNFTYTVCPLRNLLMEKCWCASVYDIIKSFVQPPKHSTGLKRYHVLKMQKHNFRSSFKVD